MNRYILILILCLFNVITYGQTEDITYYGGINSDAIISEDFEDFHISDWEKYGLGAQIGITPSFQLNDNLGLFFQTGYQISFASDPIIKVIPASGGDELEIDMKSSAIVKPNGSGTQAGINPSAYMGGAIIQLGISIKL